MIRIIIIDDSVVNVDNDEDAERLMARPGFVREIVEPELSEVFGEYCHLANPLNTIVNPDGSVTSSCTGPEPHVVALEEQAWVKEELLLANIEISYHEDNNLRAKATIEEWRTYRVALCDYVQKGADGTFFVTADSRPLRPGQEV